MKRINPYQYLSERSKRMQWSEVIEAMETLLAGIATNGSDVKEVMQDIVNSKKWEDAFGVTAGPVTPENDKFKKILPENITFVRTKNKTR